MPLIDQLAGSERGRKVLADVREMLREGGCSLDAMNWRALCQIMAGCGCGYSAEVCDLIADKLNLP